VIERALLLCDGKEIQPHNLLMHSQTGSRSINEDLAAAAGGTASAAAPASAASSSGSTLGIEVGMSMREAEKKLIFETLRQTKGNRTHAAQILGISIRTLRNKLNEYKAEGESFEFEA
jgi:DNA-binding NtrC family response regulator